VIADFEVLHLSSTNYVVTTPLVLLWAAVKQGLSAPDDNLGQCAFARARIATAGKRIEALRATAPAAATATLT
jgi:hypothetical protein